MPFDNPTAQSLAPHTHIIIDTSILMNFAIPAEHEYGNPDTLAYFGQILFDLADRGFKITIPEMVAIEFCGLTRTGEPDAIVANKNKPLRMAFLLQLLSHPRINLGVVEKDNNFESESAKICRYFHETITSIHPRKIKNKGRIVANLFDRMRGQDLGEENALQIAFDPKNILPTLFLAEDMKAHRDLMNCLTVAHSNRPIFSLNMKGLVAALAERELLPAFPISVGRFPSENNADTILSSLRISGGSNRIVGLIPIRIQLNSFVSSSRPLVPGFSIHAPFALAA
jgi:hypothetical protein